MKKRIRKKANEAIEGKITQMQDIGRDLAKLGAYHIEINYSFLSEDISTKAMINAEAMLELPFVDKKDIKIIDRFEGTFPFEARFTFEGVLFYSLLTQKDAGSLFPEKFEDHNDYIMIDSVIYKRMGENE